ncbi:MAG: hypothetical protein ACRELY_01240 [Polyangiaceae bacterium]
MRRVATVALIFGFCCFTAMSPACSNADFTGEDDASTQDGNSDGPDAPSSDASQGGDDGGITPCGATPAPSELVVDTTTSPDQITTDDVYVYWASSTGSAIERGRLGTVPAAIEPVAIRPSTVTAIGVSGGYLCWVDVNGTVLECAATSAISGSGLTDAGITEYSQQIGVLLAREADFLYTRTSLYLLGPPSANYLLEYFPPRLMASFGAQIVFVGSTDAGAESFYQILDSPGDQPLGAPFYVDPGYPSALATDGADVIFTHVADQAVYRLPTDGGPPIAIASAQPALGKVSINGGNVYFITGNGIMRAAKDGSCPTTISVDPTTSFVISGEYVYFASLGKIRRARR